MSFDEVVAGPSSVSPLPIVVWLRGDEPYYQDFSLQAEQVMAQLGIKRSRLTQISGRELRVGKARIDHYVRPVYRPEDVYAYLETVRPSTTHKKSSAVLEDARDKLVRESERMLSGLEQQLNEQAQTLHKQLNVALSQQLQQISWLVKQNDIQALTAQLTTSFAQQALCLQQQQSVLEANTQQIGTLQQQMTQGVQNSVYLKEAVVELLALTQAIEKKLQQSSSQQQQLASFVSAWHEQWQVEVSEKKDAVEKPEQPVFFSLHAHRC